jgi:hypothetical protein
MVRRARGSLRSGRSCSSELPSGFSVQSPDLETDVEAVILESFNQVALDHGFAPTELLELEWWRPAVTALRDCDGVLIDQGVSERAICHRLAMHIESQLTSPWHADCEYNRMVETENMWTAKRLKVTPRASGAVFPDVIVHHRGTSENLLALEAKVLTCRTGE